MNILSILCQRCGAPLQIADEGVRFVTCGHCGTPLEIVRESSQAHSRILEQIQAATEDHGRRLEVVELENELLQLDKEWEAVRERLCGRSKSGSLHESPMAGCTGPIVSFSVGALGFGIGLCSNPEPFLIPSIIIFTLGLVFGGIMWRSKSRDQKEFADLQSKYIDRRRQLTHKIDLAKG